MNIPECALQSNWLPSFLLIFISQMLYLLKIFIFCQATDSVKKGTVVTISVRKCPCKLPPSFLVSSTFTKAWHQARQRTFICIVLLREHYSSYAVFRHKFIFQKRVECVHVLGNVMCIVLCNRLASHAGCFTTFFTQCSLGKLQIHSKPDQDEAMKV